MEQSIANAIRNRQIAEDFERVNPGRIAVTREPYTIFSPTVPDDADCAASDEICGDLDMTEDEWEAADLGDWLNLAVAIGAVAGLFVLAIYLLSTTGA